MFISIGDNQTYVGLTGPDTFVFSPDNDGFHVIYDFDVGEDKIDLSAYEDIHSIEDLNLHEGYSFIDLSEHGGRTIVVPGIDDGLTDANFIFADDPMAMA